MPLIRLDELHDRRGTGNAMSRAKPLLGTIVSISVSGIEPELANELIEAAFHEVSKIHRLMSFHDPDSDVSRINRAKVGDPVSVDPRTINVLRHALHLNRISEGVFDIAIGKNLVELGALPPPSGHQISAPHGDSSTIEVVGASEVLLRSPTWIDLGGIAKGYAVDQATEIFRGTNAASVAVNAGGDLRVSGPLSRRVALKAPTAGPRAMAEITIENGSVASSFGRPSRASKATAFLLNAKTQQTITVDTFVSVVCEDCIHADALTKVVFALGSASDPILRQFNAHAYVKTLDEDWLELGN